MNAHTNSTAKDRGIDFWIEVVATLVRARVSHDCLEHHFGCSGPRLNSAPIVYERNKAKIDAVALAKYLRGDAPIVVTREDF